MLHGIGGHRGQWTAQVEALSMEFATFAWDARGYGQSHGPQVTSMRDFAEDLLRVFDSLELDRVIAVGHSMGGRILMEVCALMPDRLGAVVLSGAQASFLAHLDAAQRRDYVTSRQSLFVDGEVWPDAARRVAHQVLPADATEAMIARLVSDFERLDREGYLAALNASAGWDRSDILSGLKMPLAVMGGVLDTVCPPAECNRIAGLVGQGPATILDGIGHMPQIEAPETVTEYLSGFIKDHAHLASRIDTQALAGDTV
nr:alpha/beta hydrolase [Hoeflea sp. IMCC20628]